MPFSPSEISDAGMASQDFYMRNKPQDQVNYDHPFLRKMTTGKKPFPGGKQYVVENLRYRNQSNFQWYYGDRVVTYNKRQTIAHANFPWRSAHDGFSLNEDDLLQNGIEVDESGKTKQASKAEKIQLANLFQEQNEVLHEGFDEKFEKELLRDGSQDSDAIEGLDALVATDPTSGSPGGIDRSTYSYWQNNFSTGVTGANLIETMEKVWRQCTRSAKSRPDFIIMGSKALDEYRVQSKAEVSRQAGVNAGGQEVSIDPSISNLYFKGVPVVWVPAFEELDNEDSPAIEWEKRIYFINSKHLRLRPAMGYDMRTRNPPRVYDRYAYYWGLQWKGAMCMNQSNAHAVISIA